MTEEDLREVPCADRAGFLFDHPCGRVARLRCLKCRKPICERHRALVESMPHCTSCASQLTPAQSWSDTPYFYGRRRYGSYQSFWLFDDEPDSDDFTDADGASTASDGDESFENDLGAS